MAIYIPRKAPISWSLKWLPAWCSLCHNPAQFASMVLKDASHSSACCTCACTNTKPSGLSGIKKCASVKMTGVTSPVVSTSAVNPTSTENRIYSKSIGLTRDHFALEGGMDACILRLLPTSHAMARMPFSVFPGLLNNMANHVRMHSTNTDTSIQCWLCGKYKSEQGFLICPLCNAVQAPNPTVTYFQIFDQEEKFELDLKDLESKYKSLMKKLHPDLSHGKSTEEKENVAQVAALVTNAYNELLKPISRAAYMLKLRGIHVEEEGTVTDSDLIMEVMEIRETLQSLPDRTTLEQLNKTAMTRMNEWSEAFKSALKEGNDTKAVGALQRMSYFGRVCEDISRELL